MENDIVEFLRESNNIEDVWDDLSLQQALFAWNFLIKQSELSTANILKTHKILMLHHKLHPDEKGYFRKRNVWIGGHLAKAPLQIDALMHAWVESSNATSSCKKDVVEEMIKRDHISYEAIHPFIDGNGRTGRIFMNWQRIKVGLPILVIKEQEKQAYYSWFK